MRSIKADVAICTIVARNYLAYARALMASVAMIHPEIARYVFVIDDLAGESTVADARVLSPLDVFDYEHVVELAFSYDITEYSTAVKPFVLCHLLESGHDRVLYIDPDILVFSRLDPVLEPLRRANAVVTPHVTEPIPLDHRLPSERTLLQAGAFNLGFIGVRNTPATIAMLRWWGKRLDHYCVNDVSQGYFTDQKWIDLVPGLLPDVMVVRHRGCNVAYWNYHTRKLSPDRSIQLESGEPVVFFHFSGFNVRNPDAFSKHQTRIDVTLDPPLRQLLMYYREAVLANGWADVHDISYGFSEFSNGVPQDNYTRRLIREARVAGERFPDARDVHASPSAWDYVNSPVPGETLTRYQAALATRSDLQRVFPDAGGANRESYLHWFSQDAAQSVHRSVVRYGTRKPTSAEGDGVNVIGYFRAESGVAEAGRAHVRALQAAGVSTNLVDISESTVHRKTDVSLDVTAIAKPYAINLVCVNADQVPGLEAEVGAKLLAHRYNIGSWWWELPEFPPEWQAAFRPFNEIWTGTRFIQESVAAASPIPVYVVPPVVDVTDVAPVGRVFFDLPNTSTVFLFMFDFLSVFARKNPLAIVDAFQRAFGADDDVRLVIKFINGEYDPVNEGILRHITQSDSRIVLLDRYLSRGEKNALIRCSDAYVSLHRSEGFGYTLAESMLLGIPVIATGWSGNMDFMTVDNSFVVDYRLTELGADLGPYRGGQSWAEPSLESAIEHMRAVHQNRVKARSRAEVARADVRSKFSSPVVAAIVQASLKRIEIANGGEPFL